MKYVIDSSVQIKTFVTEADSATAIQLCDDFRAGIHELLVPDLLPIEVANALMILERGGKIRPDADVVWTMGRGARGEGRGARNMDPLMTIAFCLGLVALFWAYDRWVSPALDRWWWMGRAKLNLMQRKPPPKYVISLGSGGFALETAQGLRLVPGEVEWDHVERITAFKRDLYTVDMICIALHFADQSMLELDEEMGGWGEFLEALPRYLSGCRPYGEWFTTVAFPAFATNATTIYVRGADTRIAPATWGGIKDAGVS